MGTIEEGINGPFRGKAGSVIGSSWRKINYIKGLPQFRKRSPSPQQALQRRKFALLNRFLDPISGILETGFKQFTSKATGRNVAFSYNHDHAFILDGDDLRLDYPALRFSHGSLFPAGGEKAWVEDDVLHVAWDPNTYGMGRSMDDTARMIMYEETKEIFVPCGVAIRHDGGVRITHEVLKLSPIKLHLWIFFVDKAGKQVSNTVYVPVENDES